MRNLKKNDKIFFNLGEVEHKGEIIQISMDGKSIAVEYGYPKNRVIIKREDIIEKDKMI
jgi:hypothetical protein